MTRDFWGGRLVPGINVDPVDMDAGLDAAVELGFESAEDEMVTEYALARWARGEEEGAERTWLYYHPHDMTAWRMILAAAVARGTALMAQAGGNRPGEESASVNADGGGQAGREPRKSRERTRP